MNNNQINRLAYLLFVFFLFGCKSSIKEQQDKIYSRHLQRHVNLKIISTRMPDDKAEMNLLIYNNADELEQIGAKKIIDSLFREKLIYPLVLVGIDGKGEEEYGLGELANYSKRGDRADKFGSFVINELYPFVKKKTVIRKFRSVAIFGSSQAGISAFDIAWQNADKIDKVGILSGDFNYTGNLQKDSTNLVLEKIASSRKRPKLKFWLYAGTGSDSIIFRHTTSLVNLLNKKSSIGDNDISFLTDNKGKNDLNSLRRQFGGFLVWAFGK